MLVDDHPIVRDGLQQMIERDASLHVCGEAGSAEAAISMMGSLSPDIVIVDVFLDGMNGIELTKILTDQYEGIRILILSMHDESLYAERALRAGAKGYVMKQESSKTILYAIHEVLEGRRYVSSTLQQVLDEAKPESIGSGIDADTITDRLSERELHILRALGEGLDRSAIAETLQISIKTVETHRSNIKNKLNVGRSVDLADVARSWVANLKSDRDGSTV
jgi:DNA-binding NarL/FixJ family response regulator